MSTVTLWKKSENRERTWSTVDAQYVVAVVGFAFLSNRLFPVNKENVSLGSLSRCQGGTTWGRGVFRAHYLLPRGGGLILRWDPATLSRRPGLEERLKPLEVKGHASRLIS